MIGTLACTLGGGTAVIAAQTWRPEAAALGLLPAGVVLWWGLRRPLRRWRLANRRPPEAWRRWLRAHVPLYRRLDGPAAKRFERDVQFIMDEYAFEGVRGVDLTLDLRLGVAAGAATILHGRPDWELPGRRSVLFYPNRFNDNYYGGGLDADYDGMAHHQGPIILTAPSVRESWDDSGDGSNVVLHELAHLFDFENEGADGVPSLVAGASAGEWQALVRSEMRRVQRGRSMLRSYAAEAPSEFFAVAVEAFFEQPDQLARHHEQLYNALVSVFRLDPRSGKTPAGTGGEAGEALK